MKKNTTGCHPWMDDAALFHEEHNQLQDMPEEPEAYKSNMEILLSVSYQLIHETSSQKQRTDDSHTSEHYTNQ